MFLHPKGCVSLLVGQRCMGLPRATLARRRVVIGALAPIVSASLGSVARRLASAAGECPRRGASRRARVPRAVLGRCL